MIRLLQNSHWMEASHIIFFVTSGPFPGVMNLWSKVTALFRHNVIITMAINHTAFHNGDFSFVYVDAIM